MVDYKIKDIKLAGQGKRQLGWAESHMDALMSIKHEVKDLPLEGIRIAALLHVTKESGVLMRVLKGFGADISLAASNPLSTQDEVAAALAEEGMRVYAWRGESSQDYYQGIDKMLSAKPNFIIDDGGDMHAMMHEKYKDVKVLGGTEETTTGVTRLKAMEQEGIIRYPIIAINNAFTKYLFDNRIGTGQSTFDGILRATNLLIAGRCVVVAGYGWVGRGIATRARGAGARVVVTEVEPLRALEAAMEGFEVMPMERAAPIGDVFITATGDMKVIRKEHMLKMKEGAIMANSGHFDVEVDVKGLGSVTKSSLQIRDNLEEHTLTNGRRIYLLSEGRLVNLASAEGHPSEVMDLSFSNQALAIMHIVRNKLKPGLYDVPPEIDKRVASLKLSGMEIDIDTLTEEQRKYISQWKYGT